MKANFLDLDNTLIANAFINVESNLFRKVTPREFCNSAWQVSFAIVSVSNNLDRKKKKIKKLQILRN